MLSVAAGSAGAFWLFGGAELVAGDDAKPVRRYLTDSYRYDHHNGWRRIADLPRPIVAAPSPAPVDANGLYILGGDDGTQLSALPNEHHGFDKFILRYNPTTDRWTQAGELPAPRVTAPCTYWNGAWVVPGGEVRPGVRSPEVWEWMHNDLE